MYKQLYIYCRSLLLSMSKVEFILQPSQMIAKNGDFLRREIHFCYKIILSTTPSHELDRRSISALRLIFEIRRRDEKQLGILFRRREEKRKTVSHVCIPRACLR